MVSFSDDTENHDKKDDKATPSEKPAEKETISRYGSFYLRLGAIGKILI